MNGFGKPVEEPRSSPPSPFQSWYGRSHIKLGPYTAQDAIDPGCVKTRLGEGCAELFSQLPSSERSRQYNRLPYRRNRDGSSTRKLDIGVFTQPGPISDIGIPKRPLDDYFSMCHVPSQSFDGGFALKLLTRSSRVIEGPSPDIASSEAWNARSASSHRRSR
jgi:hypothetical protein